MESKDIECLRRDFKKTEERLLSALDERVLWKAVMEAGRIAGLCEFLFERLERDATPTV